MTGGTDCTKARALQLCTTSYLCITHLNITHSVCLYMLSLQIICLYFFLLTEMNRIIVVASVCLRSPNLCIAVQLH